MQPKFVIFTISNSLIQQTLLTRLELIKGVRGTCFHDNIDRNQDVFWRGAIHIHQPTPSPPPAVSMVTAFQNAEKIMKCCGWRGARVLKASLRLELTPLHWKFDTTTLLSMWCNVMGLSHHKQMYLLPPADQIIIKILLLRI